jgi:DNA-binding protein YbaB
MNDGSAGHPDGLGVFTEMTETGTAAKGLVRIEVDGTGDIVGLVIDPRAMRLPSKDLAAAIREAFGVARTAVLERVEEAAPAAMAQSAPELQALLAEVETGVQRGLTETMTVANELAMQLDRMMRPNGPAA